MENGRGSTYDCRCMQNCVGSDIHIQRVEEMEDANELLGSIGVVVEYRDHPLLRYKRKIIFSLTDFWGKRNAVLFFFLNFSHLNFVRTQSGVT